MASPLGNLGRPTFLAYFCGKVSLLVNDCCAYRQERRSNRMHSVPVKETFQGKTVWDGIVVCKCLLRCFESGAENKVFYLAVICGSHLVE
jgi:hypothetical protein